MKWLLDLFMLGWAHSPSKRQLSSPHPSPLSSQSSTWSSKFRSPGHKGLKCIDPVSWNIYSSLGETIHGLISGISNSQAPEHCALLNPSTLTLGHINTVLGLRATGPRRQYPSPPLEETFAFQNGLLVFTRLRTPSSTKTLSVMTEPSGWGRQGTKWGKRR